MPKTRHLWGFYFVFHSTSTLVQAANEILVLRTLTGMSITRGLLLSTRHNQIGRMVTNTKTFQVNTSHSHGPYPII